MHICTESKISKLYVNCKDLGNDSQLYFENTGHNKIHKQLIHSLISTRILNTHTTSTRHTVALRV